jgi:hypothetical protein
MGRCARRIAMSEGACGVPWVSVSSRAVRSSRSRLRRSPDTGLVTTGLVRLSFSAAAGRGEGRLVAKITMYLRHGLHGGWMARSAASGHRRHRARPSLHGRRAACSLRPPHMPCVPLDDFKAERAFGQQRSSHSCRRANQAPSTRRRRRQCRRARYGARPRDARLHRRQQSIRRASPGAGAAWRALRVRRVGRPNA